MPDSFVPLFPAPSPSAARLAGSTETVKKPFQPFHGKTAAALPSSADSSPPPPANSNHDQPQLTVEREGERITHIHVQCRCGERIDLECSY
jgi:hypothetical protein